MDIDVTKVIFKKFRDGDVIALFPEELGGNSPNDCSSYMRIGQHGSADVYTMSKLKAATPEEYNSLLTELQSIGYNLKVCKKFTRKMQEIRSNKAYQIEYRYTYGT